MSPLLEEFLILYPVSPVSKASQIGAKKNIVYKSLV